MAWNPFLKILTALSGSPYRIKLKRQPDHFRLAFFKGKKPINPAIISKKFKLAFPGFFSSEKTSVVLSPSRIEEVLKLLEGLSFKRLNIEIDQAIKSLKKTAPPDGALMKFTWSNMGGQIIPGLAENTTYFGDGWFVRCDCYWQLPEITPDDESWFLRGISNWKDVEKFLLEVVPDWRRRGLPFLTSIELVNEPALSIFLKECTEEAVVFDCQWRVPPETLRETPLSSAHVIADSRILPGIVPSRLPEYLRKSGIVRLEGQAIPAFRKNSWPQIKPWASGQIEAFDQVHPILEGEGELVLTIKRTEQKGIGKVIAIPEYRLGNLQVDAESLSREIRPSVDFLRIEKTWLSLESPKSIGIGPMGRMVDGTPIESFDLTPYEILIRDSSRFRGHWSKVDFHSISLPSSSSLLETGEQHLEFLRAWGIPGGLIGTPESLAEVFRESLVSFIERYPDLHILAVGSKRTLDAILIDEIAAARFDGVKKDPDFNSRLNGIVAATPKALETVPGLLSLKWDVLCVFEADTLIKTGSSKLFQNLCDCKRKLVIGQFFGMVFLERNQSKEALSQVFGNSWPLVWKYGLRDPLKDAEKLPEPRQHQPIQTTSSVRPAEIQIGLPPQSAGVPIPPRPEPSVTMIEQEPRVSSIDMEGYSIRIEVRYSSGEDSFVEKARQLVYYREHSASFVPFMCYWPTYDSMTQPQLKWYFFWRDQVRQGKYPDTDLSYIFVHVYELINNIGVKNSQDGYEQLYRLWTNYRERHARIDNYLIHWITDYILINKCQVDPLLPIQEAAKSGSWVADPDAVLPQYIDGSLAKMPLSLLDCLTDYRIRSSKFYLAGNQQLLQDYCPKTVDQVDKYWCKNGGVGLFEAFRPRLKPTVERRAYASAIYAGPQVMISLPSFVPYSEHPPLRQLLTGVAKHTENKLRELKTYKGKLRGYTLDPDVQKVIESFIEGSTARIVPLPPKPKVEIDISRIENLIRESDEVREMLVRTEVAVTISEKQPTDQGPILPSTLARPSDTPDRLLTDLEGVFNLVSRLDQNEKGLIDKMASTGWEQTDARLAEQMPGIFIESLVDRINGLSIELLGNILIVSEIDRRIVEDDYRDELEFILTQKAPHKESAESSRFSSLPEGWDSFAAQITPFQYEALKVIGEGRNVNKELQRIAEENALMPEMLIDGINELALDAVGDVIIVPGSNPPIIEEEDIETVKMVMQLKS